MTIIKPCDCKDEYQDQNYGKGLRVHNVGGKGKGKVAYCTVCSPSRQRTVRHVDFMTDVPGPVFGCAKGAFPLDNNGKIKKYLSGAKSI